MGPKIFQPFQFFLKSLFLHFFVLITLEKKDCISGFFIENSYLYLMCNLYFYNLYNYFSKELQPTLYFLMNSALWCKNGSKGSKISYKIANEISFLHKDVTFWRYTRTLGVKVRNMKMDFNIGGTLRRVGQWALMMKINDFFYSAKSLSSNK